MVYRIRLVPDAKVLSNVWTQKGNDWVAEYTTYNNRKYRVKIVAMDSAGLPNAATAQVWLESATTKAGNDTWMDSEITLDNLDIFRLYEQDVITN
ncbi:hypothetical protein BGZ68_000689 [Mortierella alpina]|nr:hypothetical protein BGZ68_000689 [Mortierella alpina]